MCTIFFLLLAGITVNAFMPACADDTEGLFRLEKEKKKTSHCLVSCKNLLHNVFGHFCQTHLSRVLGVRRDEALWPTALGCTGPHLGSPSVEWTAGPACLQGRGSCKWGPLVPSPGQQCVYTPGLWGFPSLAVRQPCPSTSGIQAELGLSDLSPRLISLAPQQPPLTPCGFPSAGACCPLSRPVCVCPGRR